jgi:hypothetical protein
VRCPITLDVRYPITADRKQALNIANACRSQRISERSLKRHATAYFEEFAATKEQRKRAVVFCIRPDRISDKLKMYRRCFFDAALRAGFVRFEEEEVGGCMQPPILGVRVPPADESSACHD